MTIAPVPSDPDLAPRSSRPGGSPVAARTRLSFRKVEQIAADSVRWGRVWGDRLVEESVADTADGDSEAKVPWLWADDQGRGWGAKSSVTPELLADLISSIGSAGVLQPILAEKHPSGGLRVVVGHRRLAACRWGLAHVPDPERRERFAELPVVILDGPLPESERRNYQLVENLARTDMQPGELAAALLYERCAVFVEQAEQGAGKVPPDQLTRIADPAERWQKLLAWRAANCPDIGASWPYVLRRLGMQMGDRRVADLVAAFRAMPDHIRGAMDHHGVRLATRRRWLRLHAGRAAAAEQIWEAVAARDNSKLLPTAVAVAEQDPTLPADKVVEAAELRQAEANRSRSATVHRRLRQQAEQRQQPVRGPSPRPAERPDVGDDEDAPSPTTDTDRGSAPDSAADMWVGPSEEEMVEASAAALTAAEVLCAWVEAGNPPPPSTRLRTVIGRLYRRLTDPPPAPPGVNSPTS